MLLRIYIPILAIATALSCGAAPKPAPIAPTTESLIEEGKSFEKQRRYDLARERYQRAIDTAPSARSRGYAARTLAKSLSFWGEYGNAVKALEIAVKATPKHPASWHDLGVLRAKLGQPKGAETALRQARQLAPGDPRPRIAIGAFLLTQKRYAEARVEYQALAELDLPKRLRVAVQRALEMLDEQLRRDGK